MQILTNAKDILQMARDERCSGYTAELMVQDLNELTTLREAGEKMAKILKWELNEGNLKDSETLSALEAWEAANK